jgi:NhaA family Na+:H+ antiporter
MTHARSKAIAFVLDKPIGILALSWGARVLGADLPPGVGMRQLLIVGVVASIGFTVSLFFATAAFPPGQELAETKMGALLSFAAAPLAIVLGARPRELRCPVGA